MRPDEASKMSSVQRAVAATASARGAMRTDSCALLQLIVRPFSGDQMSYLMVLTASMVEVYCQHSGINIALGLGVSRGP